MYLLRRLTVVCGHVQPRQNEIASHIANNQTKITRLARSLAFDRADAGRGLVPSRSAPKTNSGSRLAQMRRIHTKSRQKPTPLGAWSNHLRARSGRTMADIKLCDENNSSPEMRVGVGAKRLLLGNWEKRSLEGDLYPFLGGSHLP